MTNVGRNLVSSRSATLKYGFSNMGGKEVAGGGRNSKRNFSTSLWQGFVEKFVLEHELAAQMETIETKQPPKEMMESKLMKQVSDENYGRKSVWEEN